MSRSSAHEMSVLVPQNLAAPTSGDPRRLGRYLVIGRIGAGGTGTVYAAVDPRGGADAEVVDLACMLEETSAALVPGPLLSSTLAGVLVDHSGGAVADAHGEALAAGDLLRSAEQRRRRRERRERWLLGKGGSGESSGD